MDKITTSGSALSIAKVNQKAVFFIHNVVNLQLLKVKIEGMTRQRIEYLFLWTLKLIVLLLNVRP